MIDLILAGAWDLVNIHVNISLQVPVHHPLKGCFKGFPFCFGGG